MTGAFRVAVDVIVDGRGPLTVTDPWVALFGVYCVCEVVVTVVGVIVFVGTPVAL
jgi:hypothetical protein